MTTPTCQIEIESWGPHPGCAEFMDGPEAVFDCGDEATHHAIIEEQDLDDQGYPVNSTHLERVPVCSTHVCTITDAANRNPGRWIDHGSRLLRFEPIPSATTLVV